MVKIKTIQDIEIIVLGLYIPGVDILKYFIKKGKRCIGLDCKSDVLGYHLRKIQTYRCPDPETNENDWLDFIVQFKNSGIKKPLILNTSDTFIKAISNNSELLEGDFIFHHAKNEISSILMNKRSLVKYAEERHVPIPKTYFYSDNEDDYIQKISGFKYPCLIRPEYGKKWLKEPLKDIVNGQKLISAKTPSELSIWMEKILPHDKEIIIQETVEGPDDNLFYSVCYMSKNNRLLGYFTGQKLRIIPIHFGSASYMRTHSSKEILPLCEKLLKNSGYHGPAGIEFKKDERDSEYKIIEINTRYGLWDVIGIKVGIDLYDIAWNDLHGNQIHEVFPNEERTYYWLSLVRDLSVVNQYRKEGLITIWQWLRSILKVRYFADIYISEPSIMYRLYIKKLLQRLF